MWKLSLVYGIVSHESFSNSCHPLSSNVSCFTSLFTAMALWMLITDGFWVKGLRSLQFALLKKIDFNHWPEHLGAFVCE
jgi:hypothetical protein